jgi:hypothetical protein
VIEDRDGWYQSEEPTRLGMIAELQRIKRRTLVRPFSVIALAIIVTAGVAYKLATKPRLYHANVVLALDEGLLTSAGERGIPYDQLREYVAGVLLPDAKVVELINKHSPRRIANVGEQFAVEDFRGHLEIEIWKNSFVFYTDEEQSARKSARIGIDVSDLDPDEASATARDLASIIIKAHEEQRRKISADLTKELELMRVTMSRKLDGISRAIATKQVALVDARRTGKNGLASALMVDLSALAQEQKRATEQLRAIAASPEAVADRVTEARLDTTLTVIDERRPERQEQPWYALGLVIAVIGTGSLLGAALLVGAFDSRVHDVEDVTRLGLPVLGHVPGFQGDHVGSLDARGAARARVPSFLRWRSHR